MLPVEANHVGETFAGSLEELHQLLEAKGYVLDTYIGEWRPIAMF